MGKRLIIPGADFSTNAIEREPIPGPVPVEYTLQNGYASAGGGSSVDIDSSGAAVSIRVRTNQLYGPYTVKTKTGYVIRTICTYDTEIANFAPGNHATTNSENVSNVSGTTEFTLTAENKYSIITFCKEDSTAEISASEDIVDYIIRPLE